MNGDRQSLRAAGERIRVLEDRLLARADVLARTKERLVFDPAAYRQRMPKLPAVAAVSVLAAAAAVVLMLAVGPSALTATLNGNPVEAGAWISTPQNKPCTLSFSDGSQVEMKGSSGLRIRELTPDGAHLLLERGDLVAGVTHRKNTSWKVDVGPYLITVTGTRFHVSWNPESETFGLRMLEGSVQVEGPMIAARAVQAGEMLSASLADGSVQINVKDTTRDATPAVADMPPTPADLNPTVMDTADSKPAPSSVSPESASEKKREKTARSLTAWRRFAETGQFSEAVRTAERVGIPLILAEAGPSDLLALGDAARHSGNFQTADRVYKTVRKRFPGSTYASGAAYSLGIMSFDGKKQYREAARWFRTALRDRSRGPLSREASGRLIEALRLSGDPTAAAEAAERYLSEYPDGPHAALARRLTQ